jgi:hypothetical protein
VPAKLFADRKAKHHWWMVVADQEAFLQGLCGRLTLTEGLFRAFIQDMKTYRDRLVAHKGTSCAEAHAAP